MNRTLLLLLLILPILCLSQTTLTGGVMSGTLTASGSPYKVMGDILVPKDSTLTIEAGVTLDFDSAKLVRIEGTLNSLGTKTKPNLFTCSDSLLGWHGLFFMENKEQDTCEFRHTRFEYIGYPGKIINSPFFDAVEHSNGRTYRQTLIAGYTPSSLKFSNCIFYKNWKTFEVEDGWIELDSCLFTGNVDTFGVYSNGSFGYFSRSYKQVTNCRFIDNQVKAYFHTGSDLSNSNGQKFDNNHFVDNNISMNFNLGTIPITNCTWTRNGCAALVLRGGNEQLIENCLFDQSRGKCIDGGDVKVYDARRTVFRNCTFRNKTDNITSVYSIDDAPLFDGCVFENNRHGVYLPGTSSYGRFVNCLFINNQEALNTASKTILVNTNFINNKRTIKDPYDEPRIDSTSGAIRTTGNGSIELYNCIFWGNTNLSGRKVNLTLWGNNLQPRFYNCIVENGTSSINKDRDPTYVFTDTFTNSLTQEPDFINPTLQDFRLSSTCSGTSVGYDQGYADPIPMWYFNQTVPDILKAIGHDKNGDRRIYGNASDIGAYEIQGVGNRIDWDDTLKDIQGCLGDDLTFSAKARSLGLSAVWERWNGSNWLATGATGTEHTVQSAKTTDNGARFRVTYTNECGLSRTTDEAMLTVHTPRKLNLPNDTTILHNQSLTIKSPSGFTDHQWSTDSTSEEITVNGRELGEGIFTFSLTARDEHNCASSDEIIITINRNTSANTLQSTGIRLFPNPTSGVVHFNGTLEGVHFNLSDLSGRQWIINQFLPTQLDLSDLESGWYVLELMDGHTQQVVRLFLQ